MNLDQLNNLQNGTQNNPTPDTSNSDNDIKVIDATPADSTTGVVDPAEKMKAHTDVTIKKKKSYVKVGAIIRDVLLVVALIGGGWWIYSLYKQNEAVVAEKTEKENDLANLQLTNDELRLANQYQEIQMEYAQYENQMQLVANDSLNLKYQAAKQNVEKLLAELNSEKTKSAAQIKKLEDEIATLKGIMRHYVEEIDRLNKENTDLKNENAELKTQSQNLSSQVASYSRENSEMQERINLAEKLIVTGIDMIGLKKNGKKENNITKAKQLQVTFTIPKNNSTPVGVKRIYLRITSPEGDLLGNAGNFKFEGGSLASTAHKDVEYQGDEISNVTIYYDVTTTLNPGQYRVELFADNYRLGSKTFTMKK